MPTGTSKFKIVRQGKKNDMQIWEMIRSNKHLLGCRTPSLFTKHLNVETSQLKCGNWKKDGSYLDTEMKSTKLLEER